MIQQTHLTMVLKIIKQEKYHRNNGLLRKLLSDQKGHQAESLLIKYSLTITPFLLNCHPLHPPWSTWANSTLKLSNRFAQPLKEEENLGKSHNLQSCTTNVFIISSWAWFTHRRNALFSLAVGHRVMQFAIRTSQLSRAHDYTSVDTTACWKVLPFYFSRGAANTRFQHPIQSSRSAPLLRTRQGRMLWPLLGLCFNILSLKLSSLDKKKKGMNICFYWKFIHLALHRAKGDTHTAAATL